SKDLKSKFPGMVDKYGGETRGSKRVELLLQPLTSIHLESDLMMEATQNGDAKTVYFLTILAMAILLIAWINYLNMATAGAMERAKEVGIKKVVGVSRIQLGLQFVIEAAVINLMAMTVSFLIIFIMLPYYNSFTGYELTAKTLFYDWAFWDKCLLLYLVGTLVSGIYPAFVLSSYKPIKVLKGEWKTSSHGLILRKALVITQFAASIILITGTILVYKQIQFMQSQNRGFNSDDVLIVKAPDVIVDVAQYNRGMESYKLELLRSEHVEKVTITSAIPGRKVGWYVGSRRIGAEESDASVTLYVATMDQDYFDLLDIKLVAGRSYSNEAREDSTNVMINEKAVRMLGFENAEGSLQQKIVMFRDTMTVIGVVGNYFHQSPKEDFNPTAYRLMEAERNYFAIKMGKGEYRSVLNNAEKIYASLFPGFAFEYFFLDDFYNVQYDSDRKFNNVFNTFSMLAIIIASLGLFALASFTVAQRTKEVGIRKVLGSSMLGVFLLFVKDFFKLILIANAIAIPFVIVVMSNWLSNFAQRISIDIWVFATAGVITLFIAMISIGYHALRAALINPVETLRSE
ncbi:MAG: FtsX-like permease family protein, partial [Cyclobacteriaceae bacterium]